MGIVNIQEEVNEMIELKILELKNQGLSKDEIEKEVLSYLKDIVRNLPFHDRKQFFLSYKRNEKLKIILED
jgi:hypothetical protein